MTTLTTTLLVVAGIIVLLLIIAFVTRKTYNVQREIIINAPVQQVFDYLKQLKNQDNFNKWVMVDPNMKREFKGTDGTVGFVYAWNGNKRAGAGEQELISIVEGKKIESEVRFIRPMTGIANAVMTTEALSSNQTKVNWNNTSEMKYPANIMISMIEKMLGKDMDTSLNNLKTILEK
ncbi:MAG: SRPBCC family protein [Agriterribacter sp.]